jgi:PIN domain-containing protein
LKVALDEHIPPALIEALQSLARGGEISGHILCSARDYSPGPRAPSDIPWIRRYMDDGGEILISGEVKMRSMPEYRAGISASGAKAYYLPRRFNQWDMARRTGFILSWWTRIVEHAATVEPGECWIIPNGNEGNFRKVSDGNEADED